MCSSPKPPAPIAVTPPPDMQNEKAADLNAVRRKRSETSGIAGGTLLTGPSGVANNTLNTGGGTLLGG